MSSYSSGFQGCKSTRNMIPFLYCIAYAAHCLVYFFILLIVLTLKSLGNLPLVLMCKVSGPNALLHVLAPCSNEGCVNFLVLDCAIEIQPVAKGNMGLHCLRRALRKAEHLLELLRPNPSTHYSITFVAGSLLPPRGCSECSHGFACYLSPGEWEQRSPSFSLSAVNLILLLLHTGHTGGWE